MARKGFFSWLRDTLLPKQGGGRHSRGTNARDIIDRVENEPRPPLPERPRQPPRPPPGPGIFLEPLVRDRAAATTALGVLRSQDDADNLISDIGASNAFTVADQQLDSTTAYVNGDGTVGHDRFVDQVEFLNSLTGRKVEWEWLTNRKGQHTYRIATQFVQWFYYHGARRI